MSPSRPLGSQTVLVVAGGVGGCPRLLAGLETLGCRVVVADGAEKGHALAAETRPALVVIAGDLPGAESLHERLRSDWRCGRPGIVVAAAEDSGGRGDVPAERLDHDPEVTVGHVREMLERIHELRSASPLTGLPGNDAIREEIDRRLDDGQAVALLYVDLDGFKPYNDRYGFLRGDGVLRAVSDVLSDEAAGRPDTFVGHVGGDDFVVLARPDDAEAIAEAITTAFDAAVPTFYDDVDLARGWLAGSDRRGRPQRWPLLSVSVGVASTERRRVGDALELVDIATEMKRLAKDQPGSAVAIDRRSDGLARAARRRGRGPSGPGGAAGGPGGRHRSVRGGASDRTRDRSRSRLAPLAVALVAAVLVLGPAGAALAAGAAPGDMLWPARRWVEDTRVALASDPAARAGLHLRFADRRLADLAAALAVEADPTTVEAILAELVRHSRAAAQSAVTGDDAAAQRLRNQVSVVLGRHVDVLGDLVTSRCVVAVTGDVEGAPGADVARRGAEVARRGAEANPGCRGMEQALRVVAAAAVPVRPGATPGPPTWVEDLPGGERPVDQDTREGPGSPGEQASPGDRGQPAQRGRPDEPGDGPPEGRGQPGHPGEPGQQPDQQQPADPGQRPADPGQRAPEDGGQPPPPDDPAPPPDDPAPPPDDPAPPPDDPAPPQRPDDATPPERSRQPRQPGGTSGAEAPAERTSTMQGTDGSTSEESATDSPPGRGSPPAEPPGHGRRRPEGRGPWR